MKKLIDSPITALSGVGGTRAANYAKLGVLTIRDLVMHFPRAYENRGDVRLLSQASEGINSAVILTVSTECKKSLIKGGRRRMTLLKFRAFDDSGSCEITFFNQEYLSSTFHIGSTFRFYGKVERRGSKFLMTSPEYEPYTESVPLPPLCPVYPLTAGLSNKMISAHISQVLELAANEIPDHLPEDIRAQNRLCALSYALIQIHRPESFEALARAKRRLAFDEFFRFALGLGTVGKTTRREGAPICKISDSAMDEFYSLLPYRLTGAQERAIRDIRADMSRSTSMNRILVGDVGCGKTVCAAAAIFTAVRSGHQAALMAPTSILANQHAADLIPMFERIGIRGALLTGNTTAAQKRKIYEALTTADKSARLDFVIGTQALLSDGVGFASPALIITDEQHRFGVNQRARLSEKNNDSHLLVMSATPIPRSLALVLYGDLDISKIDEMPPGRQRVDTFVVDESYRPRLEAFIRKNVDAGGQVYVVCPAVEEKTQPELEREEDMAQGLIPLTANFDFYDSAVRADKEEDERSVPEMRAAVQFAEELGERLEGYSVAFVHGKMKSSEKDAVMRDFVDGKIQVLVSTTVIEVGVNVPNACLMIVENAERFGLSQLHQLRGRVGRGNRKSYCVLVSALPPSAKKSTAYARLEAMKNTYDGYKIAEQDLALRGPGDFLAPASSGAGGIRQSGGFDLKMAEGWQDSSLMESAFAAAHRILDADADLSLHPLLREIIYRTFEDMGNIMN